MVNYGVIAVARDISRAFLFSCGSPRVVSSLHQA